MIMKKLKSNCIIFCILLLFGCQDNEIFTNDNDISKAQSWFEQNKNGLDSKISNPANREGVVIKKTPDWSQSKIHVDKYGVKSIEVALEYDTYLFFAESNNKIKRGTPNVLNSMLLFELEEGKYAVYLLKIYPSYQNTKIGNHVFENLNFSEIPSDFSGDMLVFDWDENFIGGWKISDGEKQNFYVRTNKPNPNGRITSNLNSTCYEITTNWYSVTCIDGVCGDPVLVDSSSVIVCETTIAPPDPLDPDSGGGGDGGTCFVPHPLFEGLMLPCDEVEDGIDCASFQFIKTNSNWQESSLVNVGFKIKYINPQSNLLVSSELTITRPIWFGFPVRRYDGTEVSSGKAAELAASAVQYASDLTHILYIQNPNMLVSLAEQTFIRYLQSRMRDFGGRADFYGSGSPQVLPKAPSYSLFGNGDCD